jgi:hypothetical protein
VSVDEKEWTWIEGKRIFPGQTNQAPYTRKSNSEIRYPITETRYPKSDTLDAKP